MLSWHVMSRMLATALYFALCGAFGCALFLVAHAFVIVLILLTGNVISVTGLTLPTSNQGAQITIYFGVVMFTGVGFLFGFASGAVIFFIAGLMHGAQPIENLPKSFKRSFHAALWAALCCGWAGALTGVAFVAVMNLHMFPGFTYGLAAGNFVGIAIGAFSPGTVERARDALKAAFASLRHR